MLLILRQYPLKQHYLILLQSSTNVHILSFKYDPGSGLKVSRILDPEGNFLRSDTLLSIGICTVDEKLFKYQNNFNLPRRIAKHSDIRSSFTGSIRY
jgi:hypothetical protein